jgi:hypothetical protein
MKLGYAVVTMLALALGAGRLAAQQPAQPTPAAGDSARRAAMRVDMQAHMRMMDSTTTVLDRQIQQMNSATGNAKVTAMAQVINTLVAERKATRSYMRQMMETHGRRAGHMSDHMKEMPHDSMHGRSQ